MDIDLLSKMVKELILDNNEVTLGGVGTFVAELIPSTFSDKGYTINPPYRRLSFTPREAGDTLLRDLYARSNAIDPASAQRILDSFMKDLKEVLLDKKVIIFPGLGRLRATRENNLFFVADEDLDIYPAGYGLEAISLKTHVETPEEVSAALDDLSSIMAAPAPEPAPASVEHDEPVAETATAEGAAPTAAEDAIVEEVAADVAEALVSEDVVEPSTEEVAETAAEEVVETAVAEDVTESTDAVVEVTEVKPSETKAPAGLKTKAKPEVKKMTGIVGRQAGPNRESQNAVAHETRRHHEPKREHKYYVPPRRKKRKPMKTILIIIGILVLLAVVALAAFLLTAYLAPDFLDKILYSAEELRILNY